MCILGFMGTCDVLKVFKIARAVGDCNLKSFQNITSDHKSRNSREVDPIFCLFYPQQNHSVALLCKPKSFQRFPKCLHVSFEPQLQ